MSGLGPAMCFQSISSSMPVFFYIHTGISDKQMHAKYKSNVNQYNQYIKRHCEHSD